MLYLESIFTQFSRLIWFFSKESKFITEGNLEDT